MNLTTDELEMFKRMLGEPTVTWSSFGVKFTNRRVDELDSLVDRGFLKFEVVHMCGPTESYMYSITNKTKNILAAIYFKTQEI